MSQRTEHWELSLENRMTGDRVGVSAELGGRTVAIGDPSPRALRPFPQRDPVDDDLMVVRSSQRDDEVLARAPWA